MHITEIKRRTVHKLVLCYMLRRLNRDLERKSNMKEGKRLGANFDFCYEHVLEYMIMYAMHGINNIKSYA